MKKAKERVIDLDKGQLKLLKEIIRRHVPDKIVWAYGSRVRWKAQDASDLDLVVFDCSTTEKVNLIEAFEESDLLVSVSVMAWEDIPEEFKEEIRGKYVVVQEKVELKSWREVRLGDIANISNGKANSQDAIKGGIYPLFDRSQLVKRSDRYIFDTESIIVPGEGKEFIPKFYSGRFDLHQRCYAIHTFSESAYASYIYYFIYSNRGIFEKFAVGSTVPSLRLNHFQNFPILLPPLAEQKAIAEILSCLDEKIDLLRRQNETLEELAETLFRHRFIERKDETWERCVIGDLCGRLSSGGTPATANKEYYDGNINWFSTKELKDDFLFESRVKITEEGLMNSTAKIFPKGTVIIAIYAAPTVGRLGILANEATFNQAACGLIADEKICCKEFLYLYLMHSRRDLNAMASGSAQQNLNVTRIKDYPVFKPDEKTMREFKSTSSELFDKIENNGYQIRNLRNLRDTLLPKLINGEVRVKSTSQNDEARFS